MWPTVLAASTIATVVQGLTALRIERVNHGSMMGELVRTGRAEYTGEAQVCGPSRILDSGSMMIPVRLPQLGDVPLFIRPDSMADISKKSELDHMDAGSTISLSANLRLSDRPEVAPVMLSARGQPHVSEPATGMWALTSHLRRSLGQAAAAMPGRSGELISGMVVGDTSGQNAQTTNDMVITGLSHLSAVSGSNVAIVAASTMIAGSLITPNPRRTAPLAITAVVVFLAVVGPDPSVVRATVMGLVGLVAMIKASWSDSFAAASVAVIAMMLWDPDVATDYAFSLSVAATVGIIGLSPIVCVRLEHHFQRFVMHRWGRMPREVEIRAIRVFGVSMVADCVTAPIIVHMTGIISPTAIMANILVSPAVPPITVIGLIASVLASVLALAHCSLEPASWLLMLVAIPEAWIRAVAHTLSQVWIIRTPGGGWWAAVWAAIVLLALATLLHAARFTEVRSHATGSSTATRWRGLLNLGWMSVALASVCAVGAGQVGVQPYDQQSHRMTDDLSHVDGWLAVVCRGSDGGLQVHVAGLGLPSGCATQAGEPDPAAAGAHQHVTPTPPSPPHIVVVDNDKEALTESADAIRRGVDPARIGIVVKSCGKNHNRRSSTPENIPVAYPCRDPVSVIAPGKVYRGG